MTTRRLADKVEYSQPVLYGHFANMEAIRDAVAIEGIGEMAELLREARLAAPEHEAIRAVCTAYLEFAAAHPAAYQAMFSLPTNVKWARAETPAPLRAAFNEIVSAFGPVNDRNAALAELVWVRSTAWRGGCAAAGSRSPRRSSASTCSSRSSPTPPRRAVRILAGRASRISELVLDCEDPERLAAFWSHPRLHRTRPRTRRRHRALPPLFGGLQPTLLLSPSTDPNPGTLPLHIDVNATDRDQDAELERLLALGARPADVGQTGDENWHVLQDPEGITPTSAS